jgi:hypothetical protein
MPVAGSCGGEDLANLLLTSLLGDKQFDFEPIDLTDPQYQLPDDVLGDIEVRSLTNEELTTKTINGDGTFDVIMASVSAHLKGEFEKGRITGEQYTKAYIELVSASLSSAIQFLLQRDQAFWQAIAAKSAAQVAQVQVVKARVDLEIAKTQLQQLRFQAATAEVEYGLTKMKLSTESITYCTAKFNLEQILPEQKILLEEQVEERRAQTLGTRRDGTTVVGVLGKQQELYDQQITSYKRDAEVKVAKIFSDAWITMKTLDEGLLPPSGFTNANLDEILEGIKNNVGLTP